MTTITRLSKKLLRGLQVHEFDSHYIQKLINDYCINNKDFNKYRYSMLDMNGINKNKVISNTIFDIYIISWNVGVRRSIYNKNGDSWLKVIDGNLIQNIYSKEYPYIQIDNKELTKDCISYINNNNNYTICNILTNKPVHTLHVFKHNYN